LNIPWKSAGYVLAILFAGLLLIKGIIPGWTRLHSDFSNYYVSAKLITDGVPLDHLYDNEWFQGKIKDYGIDTPGKFSPFPPITTFVMLPLTVFEPLTAQRIFTLINLLFVGIGIITLKKLTSWSTIAATLFLLGAGLGLINNIAFGQVYLIMTVFILFAFLLVNHNHFLLAGIILGVFTAIKYFPIVLIAGFFLNGCLEIYQNKITIRRIYTNGDFRVVFYGIISFLLLLTVQYFYFGKLIFNDWIYSAFLPHLDSELEGQGMFSYYFQSWDSLLRNLFVYDPQFNPHPFLDWKGGKLFFKITIAVLIALITAWTLFKIRSGTPPIRRAVCLSIPSVAALVLLPASATYHFILLVPSLVLIIRQPDPDINRHIKVAILVLYGFIGLIPYNLLFNLSEQLGLWLAYPRLWLISILFVVVVVGMTQRSKSVVN